jgi:hypothetical protein
MLKYNIFQFQVYNYAQNMFSSKHHYVGALKWHISYTPYCKQTEKTLPNMSWGIPIIKSSNHLQYTMAPTLDRFVNMRFLLWGYFQDNNQYSLDELNTSKSVTTNSSPTVLHGMSINMLDCGYKMLCILSTLCTVIRLFGKQISF